MSEAKKINRSNATPPKLAIVILGEQDSGKSTLLKKLFYRNIKTGWKNLNLRNQPDKGLPDLKTDVLIQPFVIYGSPTESGRSIKKTLFEIRKLDYFPKILIAACQYGTDQSPPNDYDPKPTLEYILNNYERVHVLWLNPGYTESHLNKDRKKPYRDTYQFLEWLLPKVWVRYFNPKQHDVVCQEIRKIVSGFALYH